MGKLRIIGSRLLVKEIKEEKKSTIIIPNKEQEPSFKGIVLSAGEGAILDNGERIPLSVKEGDTVIYQEFSGTPIKHEGEIFIILNERDVLAVIE